MTFIEDYIQLSGEIPEDFEGEGVLGFKIKDTYTNLTSDKFMVTLSHYTPAN